MHILVVHAMVILLTLGPPKGECLLCCSVWGLILPVIGGTATVIVFFRGK